MSGVWRQAPRSHDTVFGHGQVVSGGQYDAQQIQTTAASATYRTLHRVPAGGTTGVRLLYPNSGTVPVTVRGSIDSSDYTSLVPVRFDGADETVIAPGGFALTDPVELLLHDFFDRSFISGDEWVLNAGSRQAGEGDNIASASGVDATVTGSVPTTTNLRYAPIAVTGRIVAPPPVWVVAVLLGDSVAAGSNDLSGGGFVHRALRAAAFDTAPPLGAVLNVALGGEGAADLPLVTGAFRWAIAAGATHAVEEYGINDITGGATAAVLGARRILLWKLASARGLKVIATTTLPNSNNNPTKEGVRVAHNDWLRAGAPIDPTTLEYQASASPTSLLVGRPGHPLTHVADTADAFETARNSGIPKDGLSSDGVHPTPAGCAVMASTLPPAYFGIAA